MEHSIKLDKTCGGVTRPAPSARLAECEETSSASCAMEGIKGETLSVSRSQDGEASLLLMSVQVRPQALDTR